jgi:hypothetical protein
MCDSVNAIGSLDDLRTFVHRTLCEQENLLPDQFQMSEMRLWRRDRDCGIQFSLQGPRSVRLGAIWASEHNTIYFYNTRGQRYHKVALSRRVAGLEGESGERPAA